MATSGCSWALIDRAPPRLGPEPVHCSTGRKPVVADLVIAAAFTGLASWGRYEAVHACDLYNSECDVGEDLGNSVAIIGALVALFHVSSATSGVMWTRTCAAERRRTWQPPLRPPALTARLPPRPIVAPLPELTCELFEIEVSRGAAPARDPALTQLAAALAPLRAWNQFHLLRHTIRRFAQRDTAEIALASGAGLFTAEAGPSGIRTSLSVDDDEGRHVFRPRTVPPDRFALHGPRPLAGHTRAVAVACHEAQASGLE